MKIMMKPFGFDFFFFLFRLHSDNLGCFEKGVGGGLGIWAREEQSKLKTWNLKLENLIIVYERRRSDGFKHGCLVSSLSYLFNHFT